MDLRLVVPAAACWAVTGIGLTASRGVLVAVILGAIGTSVAVLVAPRLGRVDPASVLAATGLAAGIGVALLVRADRVDAHPVRQFDGGAVAVVITATEDPKVSAAHPDLVWVRARLVAVDGQRVAPADVLVFASGAPRVTGEWLGVQVGVPVRVSARVRVPAGRGLVAAALTARGPPQIAGRAPVYLRAAETVRSRFRQVCAEGLGHREAGLLPGLVVGDTSMGESGVDEQFRRAGLTHLLAVSGANFALIVGTAVLLAALVAGSVRVTVAVGLVVTVAFAVLVQLSPSVIRAAIMGGIGLLAMVASRRREAIPALAAAVVVALLVWPTLAVDAGFAMSVAATAALIVWSPHLRDRLLERGVPRGAADAVAMAVVAYLATAPLVAMISGRLSLTAVLANLAVAPVIPVVTLLGALAMVLAVPDVAVSTALARVVVSACEPGLWWILVVAHRLGETWAAVPVTPLLVLGVAVGALGVRRLWRRYRRAWPRGMAGWHD